MPAPLFAARRIAQGKPRYTTTVYLPQTRFYVKRDEFFLPGRAKSEDRGQRTEDRGQVLGASNWAKSGASSFAYFCQRPTERE
jgi:hypothetical protein